MERNVKNRGNGAEHNKIHQSSVAILKLLPVTLSSFIILFKRRQTFPVNVMKETWCVHNTCSFLKTV